jgi:hypothetical protein
MKYEMKTDRAIAARCLSLVRPMNARIATVILLATCPFATALADTKVVLPDSQRFADTGSDFLLETTIPGDFKTLECIVWGLLIVIPVPGQTVLLIFFPRCHKLHFPRRRVRSLFTCTFAVYGETAARWFFGLPVMPIATSITRLPFKNW